MLRPSSLPALALCPCFEPGSSDYADEGTQRHEALKAALQGRTMLLDALADDDREAVQWALDYIRLHINDSEGADLEQPVSAILPGFVEVNGTPDVVSGLNILDFKWRRRDYSAQMAAYALARIQQLNLPSITIAVHLVFGATRQIETLKFTEASAIETIQPIVERFRNPNKQAEPCDYCGWCSLRLSCPALNERAQAVAAGREDWKLQSYHSSELTNPAEMAKALALAKHLKTWCDAVTHNAKEMAIKQGVTIPGYTLKAKSGKSSCHDVAGAFNALQVPQDEFLACCDLRLNTSKRNAAQKGVIDVYAAARGISKAAAKRELKQKLEPYLRTPAQVYYLQADSSPENETSEEE